MGAYIWLQGRRINQSLDVQYRTILQNAKILYFREGLSSSVSVVRYGTGTTSLLVNGKADASNGKDMETQVNLAAIPMLLHPSPRKVAIIGLGSGVTAGTATLFPETQEIDVVELESAVVDAASYFNRENRNVMTNAKCRLYVEDGRTFVRGKEAAYDVLVSEPSNPWMAGVANLFTKEFFGMVRDSLSPGGLFCQWLQAYSLSPDELKTVSRTFLEVFPDASLWLSGENDLILLGWKEKHSTQALGTIRKRIRESSGIAEAARFFGIQPAEGLLSGYILGPVELRAYSGKGPFHTDDHPILEYSSPRSFFFPTVSYSNLREIAGFKSSSFPPFVTVAESERADTHHRIGMNLLIRNRWGGAKREFSMASSRARDPGGIPEVSTAEWIPFVGPSSDIRESFEGEMMRLPLIPRLGVFRPDDAEAEDLSSWLSSMEEFTVASGIAAGAGVGGGNGLVIRGVAGVASSGYFSPLRVNPSTSYTVEFAMKSNLEEGGEAGVGILEYDDPSLPGVEPTQAVNARHLVGAHDAVRIRGERDWKAISFTFRTSPRTRMVHLLFYREGKSDRDIVAFDDIIVRRFR